MKKLLSFFKNFDKPFIWGAGFLFFGLCFILLPSFILDWVIAVFGAVIILHSALKIAAVLSEREAHPFYTVQIIRSSAICFFGIMLLVLRSGFASLICALVGIYLILRSVIHLLIISRIPHERSASVKIEIAVSVILIIFGLWLIIYPVWPRILLGVALIVLGVEILRKSLPQRGRAPKDGGVYYTDDFEDKTGS